MRLKGLHPNVNAFGDMLAVSEGTADQGDDGYNVLVGSTKARPSLFNSYDRHPNVLVELKNKKGVVVVKSTAAGRYQLLYRYWGPYVKLLRLQGFGPEVQDAIAIQQIRERKALPAIMAGDFAEAVHLCRNIWASLPGAGYGQHENTLEALQAAYVKAGGNVTT